MIGTQDTDEGRPHAAQLPTDPATWIKIIGFLPGLLQLLIPGPERKAKQAARRRQKLLERYQEWLDPARAKGNPNLPITWSRYEQLVNLYDDQGTSWPDPPPPEFWYDRVGAKSVQPVIDLRGTLAESDRHNYSRTALANKQLYIPHMSGAESDTPQSIARFHVSPKGVAPNGLPTGKGWPGIGYHRVITPDGQRYLCHDYTVQSYHCGGSNHKSIGTCLIGNFNAYPPTPAQIDALVQDIIEYNEERTSDPQLSRCSLSWHDVERPGWTTCPGKFFPRQEVADRVAAHYSPPPPPPPLNPETDPVPPPVIYPPEPTPPTEPAQRKGCNPFSR